MVCCTYLKFCVWYDTSFTQVKRSNAREVTFRSFLEMLFMYSCPRWDGRSSTRCNFRKHLQIKKTLSSIWQRTRCKCSQHNQKRNALQIKCIWLCCEHLQHVSLLFVSICTICCQHDENVFLICWCFFYLHVFSEVSARWALSATVEDAEVTASFTCAVC